MEKSLSDEHSSVDKGYFVELLLNPDSILKCVQNMDSKTLLDFYIYTVGFTDDPALALYNYAWQAVLILEEFPAVKIYKGESIETSQCEVLSEADELEIEETIKLLESRRHPSLMNRLVKYFKK